MTKLYGKRHGIPKSTPKEEQDATKVRLNELIRLLWYVVFLLAIIALIQFAFFLKDMVAVWIS